MMENTNAKFCQSCTMPLEKPEDFGTEAGGVPSEDYCVHCRKDGKFEMDCTMEQMIDFCVPYSVEAGLHPDAEAARTAMLGFFPQLKRWAKQAVWFISYKLVEGASVQDFLLAAEKACNEVLSKKKGYVSWKMLADGDTWADLVTWETMEDSQNAEKDEGEANPNPVAQKFYSFIDFSSLKHQVFSVEKSY
jgi:hypothetical protein